MRLNDYEDVSSSVAPGCHGNSQNGQKHTPILYLWMSRTNKDIMMIFLLQYFKNAFGGRNRETI